jgi:hypothetical protein
VGISTCGSGGAATTNRSYEFLRPAAERTGISMPSAPESVSKIFAGVSQSSKPGTVLAVDGGYAVT